MHFRLLEYRAQRWTVTGNYRVMALYLETIRYISIMFAAVKQD